MFRDTVRRAFLSRGCLSLSGRNRSPSSGRGAREQMDSPVAGLDEPDVFRLRLRYAFRSAMLDARAEQRVVDPPTMTAHPDALRDGHLSEFTAVVIAYDARDSASPVQYPCDG